MDETIKRALAEGTGTAAPNVAAALGMSRNGFYEAIKRGEVAVTRLGRRIIIPAREVRRLLDAEQVAPVKREAAAA